MLDRRSRRSITVDDVLLHHGPHVGHLGLHHVELFLNMGIDLLRVTSVDDLGHFSLMVGEDCDHGDAENDHQRSDHANGIIDGNWHSEPKSIVQFEHIYIVSVFWGFWFQIPGKLAGCSLLIKSCYNGLMSEPKQLTSTQLWLLHAWLYAPTALAGSVLMGLLITKAHLGLAGIPACLCLFVATLLVMNQLRTLEEKNDPSQLLKKMGKFALGTMFPLLFGEVIRLVEGKHVDWVSNLQFDLGAPLLFTPLALLIPTKEKKKKVSEAKA